MANYSKSLMSHNSDVMFMNPEYTSAYTAKSLKEMEKKGVHYRRRYNRQYGVKAKINKELTGNRVSVGVQTE